MRRLAATVTACAVVAVCAPVAEAWKCDKHPEQPTCTTTVPTTAPETTTSYPPVSVSQPNPPTSLPTTTTTSTSVPPVVSLDPPSVIRLAG